MRDLLFRGKRKDNGEWVESGSIIRGLPDDNKSHYCYYIGSSMRGTWYLNQQGNITAAETHEECIFYEVDPETVGQYTGLRDKNGAKIFEGDICRNTRTGEIVSVKWHGTMAGYVWSKRKENCCLFEFGELFRAYDKYEIIGNIHDNPELLEVSK